MLNLGVDYYKTLTLTAGLFRELFYFYLFLVLFAYKFLSFIIKHVTTRYIPARVN